MYTTCSSIGSQTTSSTDAPVYPVPAHVCPPLVERCTLPHATDPLTDYLRRIDETADEAEGSGLGLARIRAATETQCVKDGVLLGVVVLDLREFPVEDLVRIHGHRSRLRPWEPHL